jgi:hypothetical protein
MNKFKNWDILHFCKTCSNSEGLYETYNKCKLHSDISIITRPCKEYDLNTEKLEANKIEAQKWLDENSLPGSVRSLMDIETKIENNLKLPITVERTKREFILGVLQNSIPTMMMITILVIHLFHPILKTPILIFTISMGLIASVLLAFNIYRKTKHIKVAVFEKDYFTLYPDVVPVTYDKSTPFLIYVYIDKVTKKDWLLLWANEYLSFELDNNTVGPEQILNIFKHYKKQ